MSQLKTLPKKKSKSTSTQNSQKSFSKNLPKNSPSKKLEVVELKRKLPVLIPLNITKKIQYLCSKIDTEEWSGVLFYSLSKDVHHKDCEIVIKDIYPMDKGSSAYTEYEFDETFIDFRMDNTETFDWELGHIHSHNSMSSYFSGTDMSELSDNSENHNFYLSLIVNNKMEMVAKMAFIAEEESKTTTKRFVPNESGGFKMFNLKTENKDKYLFTYDCDITYEYEKIEVPETFGDRVDTIIKEAEEAKKARKLAMNKSYKGHQGNYQQDGYQQQFGFGNEYLSESYVHSNSLNKTGWLPEDEKRLTDLLGYCLTGDMDNKLDLNHSIKEGYKAYVGTLENKEDYLMAFSMSFASMFPYYMKDKFDLEDEQVYEKVSSILLETTVYEGHEDFIADLTDNICI